MIAPFFPQESFPGFLGGRPRPFASSTRHLSTNRVALNFSRGSAATELVGAVPSRPRRTTVNHVADALHCPNRDLER
jgi:hypothetical protein